MFDNVGPHNLMRQLKDRFQQSYFLYLDTAANARLRSRFRHDRIGGNAQMFRMNQGQHFTTSSPECIVCQQQTETITHMIEECPLYALPRLILSHLLKGTTWGISTLFVLGAHVTSQCWTDRTKRGPTRLLLLRTASFLRSICHLRGLHNPWQLQTCPSSRNTNASVFFSRLCSNPLPGKGNHAYCYNNFSRNEISPLLLFCCHSIKLLRLL